MKSKRSTNFIKFSRISKSYIDAYFFLIMTEQEYVHIFR